MLFMYYRIFNHLIDKYDIYYTIAVFILSDIRFANRSGNYLFKNNIKENV